jgi:hypothetical protein
VWRRMASAISRIAFEASLMLVCLHMAVIVIFCPGRSGSAVKALVREEAERRAVAEFPWDEGCIGLLWAAAIVQLPAWLALWFFMFGTQCASERALPARAKAWLWTALTVLTLGGLAFFIAAQQENPQDIWGLSPVRFVPLVFSGFPAGMLANATHHGMRWATILPSTLAFFLVFVYIAASTPSLV